MMDLGDFPSLGDFVSQGILGQPVMLTHGIFATVDDLKRDTLQKVLNKLGY